MRTRILAVAAGLAALLLPACAGDDPGAELEPEPPPVNDDIPLPPHAAYYPAMQAAKEEIRRTFTVEEVRARLWRERWPELWGPDGVDAEGHGSPPFGYATPRTRDCYLDVYFEENRHVNPHFDRYLAEKRPGTDGGRARPPPHLSPRRWCDLYEKWTGAENRKEAGTGPVQSAA